MAMLCTIRLLRQLPDQDDLPVSCVTFACPTLGNAALAELTSRWAPYLRNYLLPGTGISQGHHHCLSWQSKAASQMSLPC